MGRAAGLLAPPHRSDRSAAPLPPPPPLPLVPSNCLKGWGTSPQPSRSNLSRSVSSKEILRSVWRIFCTTHPPPHPSHHLHHLHHSLTTPPSPLHEDTEPRSCASSSVTQSGSLLLEAPRLPRSPPQLPGEHRRTGEPPRSATLLGRTEQKSNSFIMEVCVLRGGAHGLIAGPAA